MSLTLAHGSGPHARSALSVAGHVYGRDGILTQHDPSLRLCRLALPSSPAPLEAGLTATVRLLVRHRARALQASGDEKAGRDVGELLPSDPVALSAVEGHLSALNAAAAAAGGGDAFPPALLSSLNAVLLLSAFLGGARMSAADLAWFGALSAPGAAEGAAKGRPHLARWMRHMRRASGAAALLPDAAADAADEAGGDAADRICGGGAGGAAAGPTADELAAWMDGGKGAFDGLGPIAAGGAFAANANSKKKQKKEKKKKEKKQAAAAVEPAVGKLDVRVGRVAAAENHPEADKLYVLRVEVGEGAPRTVVAGLRGFIPLDALDGAACVVLCNVPAGDMLGVESNGRMLVATAAEDPSKKVLVAPPAGAKPGERVSFEGVRSPPEEVIKKKALAKVLKGFKTSPDCTAMWENLPFTTSAGACAAEGVPGGSVA